MGKGKYLKEIAEDFGVDRKTMREWLRPFKKRFRKGKRRLYTENEIKIIYDCIEKNEDEI